VPAGWMPAPGTHSFAIMPCPAADPGPMMHMGHDPARQDHSKGSGDCFSPLLAGAALPTPPVPVASPVQAPAVEPSPLAPARFSGGPAAPPPHSTGPPAIA
jgi:hypothetical protein